VPRHSFSAAVLRPRRLTNVFLVLCCVFLVLLWLPGIRYPIVSDTAIYALLGKTFWQTGRYELLGMPYAKHLPFHAIVSYPFSAVLGFQWGMKVSSLAAGMGVLLASFFLLRRTISEAVAAGTVLAILFHPGFVLMSMLGSSDLLFACLFLLSLLAYVRAEDDGRWYVAAGVLAGLACLTRYNGVPLFPLFLFYTWWKRPRDVANFWFWLGMGLGVWLFGLWFLRNFLVFGNPFHSAYVTELGEETRGPVRQTLSNFLYYLNPAHNVFPFLFPFLLYGLWRHARRYPFLILAMLSAWVLTSFWWVQAIRFAFPGYPILLAFAILGLIDASRFARKHLVMYAAACVLLFAVSQTPVFCLYTYGQCNAWFDRTEGLLPKNLGLSPEGLFTWSEARDYLDRTAASGAYVLGSDSVTAVVWREGVFRPDLRVVPVPPQPCRPSYYLAQKPPKNVLVRTVFESPDEPHTFVYLESCP
jgi:4-amino-4-deoxy-L-arabinose transferase-like glycosyltransferase